MRNTKHRIFILDKYAPLSGELRALLIDEADLEIVGQADNGCDAVHAIGQSSPALVLLDLTVPDITGIETLTAIKTRYPNVRVIVMSVHKNEEFIRACLAVGADGYVLKDAMHEELPTAIHSVLQQPAVSLLSLDRDPDAIIRYGKALSILLDHLEDRDASRDRRRGQSLSHRVPVRHE